jgi:hypothetical protein
MVDIEWKSFSGKPGSNLFQERSVPYPVELLLSNYIPPWLINFLEDSWNNVSTNNDTKKALLVIKICCLRIITKSVLLVHSPHTDEVC